MRNSLLSVLLIFLLFGCHSNTDNFSDGGSSSGVLGIMDVGSANMEAVSEEIIEVSEDVKSSPQQIRIKQPDKIIKEARIKFEVDEYRSAKQDIDSLVNKWGGYISKEDERHTSYQIDNSIIIRVSSKNFESLLNDIGNTSRKIDYKSVNSIDVTEEYIDIVSRIKTKREVEKRYYEILKRATKIKDILEVENEIRQIREEIEAKEGRLKYLEDRVSYSTITLTVYQKLQYKYTPKKESGFFARIYKAIDKGWKGLLSFFVALMHIWPLLILAGGAGYFILRKNRNKKGGK